MSTLVVGASGYIGKRIMARLGCDPQVWATSTNPRPGGVLLDLGRPNDFDYSLVRESDLIVLAAAISSPDVCANQQDFARSVNVAGTGRFIERCMERKARVLFLSSDTVYGAAKEQINESAPINPAGDYAEMKAEVERAFLGHIGFKSFRLSYVFSREDKFTRYLTDCGKARRKAEVFHPFARRMVHREDVVEAVIRMREHWPEIDSAVLNVGGPELLSRWDLAAMLKETVMPDLEYTVVEPEEEFFFNRPKAINMDSPFLQPLLGRPSRTIREAVQIEFRDVPL